MNTERKNRRILIIPAIFIFLVFTVLFYRGSIKYAEGTIADNVAGYAWSSTFGWISMNCYQIGSNTCSSNGGYDYGVKINPFGGGTAYNFDGYAWSSGAGWISFRDVSTPPPDNYHFNVNCKAGSTCNASTNCTACFNPDTGNIYGWAKVLNLGTDGWVALSATSTSPGVVIDLNSASGTFIGYGWNGSTDPTKGMGWVSFSCSTCGAGNYQTYLRTSHRPAPTTLTAPNWSFASACPAAGAASGVGLNAIVRWVFSDSDLGSFQSGYQVIISRTNSTTSPPAFDTGRRTGSASQFTVVTSTNTFLNTYNTPFYWWVKVWDDFGFSSPWVQFNTSTPGHVLTDNVAQNEAVGNSQTFTTYRHEMPLPYFNKVPKKILAGYPATSTDASFYFDNAAPNVPVPCTPSRCAWLWSGTNVLTNTTPTVSSTVMTFSYGDFAKITDTVTDSENYSCSSSTPDFFVDVLPFWKERKAQ